MNIKAAMTGPGGIVNLGDGAGTAEEGITIEPTGDKNVMDIGADGTVMHSLRSDKSATVTVTLQRTSSANAQLQIMYNLQTSNAKLHGRNVIALTNTASGDALTCSEVAFAKAISNPYAVEGGHLAWTFHAGKVDGLLGLYNIL
jgi:hypothetical protein